MVIVFPYGQCAICDAGNPPRRGTRKATPRVICDRPECAKEASRYGAAILNARLRRRAAEREAATERRCPRCEETKPLDRDHWYVDRRDKTTGQVVRWARWCKLCKREYQRIGNLPADRVEARRETKRRQRERETERRATDPERAERDRARWRKSEAERRQRDPNRVREARRRYEAKLKSDPVRHRAALERNRMNYRLRRERQGLPVNQRQRRERERDEELAPMARLPAKPLADFVTDYLHRNADNEGKSGVNTTGKGATTATLAQSLGITARTVWEWRSGRRGRVNLDSADRILTAMGVLWFDVWDPEEYPEVARVFDHEAGAA